MTHVKDKTESLKMCGVVYTYIKWDNCDLEYEEEPVGSLETRLKEHTIRLNSTFKEDCDIIGHSIVPENTVVLTSKACR